MVKDGRRRGGYSGLNNDAKERIQRGVTGSVTQT